MVTNTEAQSWTTGIYGETFEDSVLDGLPSSNISQQESMMYIEEKAENFNTPQVMGVIKEK